MHTGSCLCGAVRFRVAGKLAPVQLCHCGQCRKAQGSAFGANIPVAVADLTFLAGEEALKAYEHTPGKERVFCPHCGSPIFSRRLAMPDVVRLRAGTLDADANPPLGFHIQTDSRALWWPLADDGLPHYPEAGPA